MIGLLVLFALSIAGVACSFLIPGYSDLLLVAGPTALASLYLFLRTWTQHSSPSRKDAPGTGRVERRKRSGAGTRAGPRRGEGMMVLDGSNIMHWHDEVPKLSTVQEVINRLTSFGFTPGIVFDANAGYKLEGRYLTEKAFARKLGLPREHVMVVAKGNPADPILLGAAHDLGARVVSNDRFRDWVDEHPELNEPGHVIRGGYRDGQLWLSVDPDNPRAQRASQRRSQQQPKAQ